MYVYALKEIVSRYTSMHTSIFLCFTDASKAFDRINHERLFEKLLNRSASNFFVRILVFWYAIYICSFPC